MIKKIKQNCIIPSAAYGVTRAHAKYYQPLDKIPQMGDLMYGEVTSIGHHVRLESQAARIHSIDDGTFSIFVVGARYAVDQFEGTVPTRLPEVFSLISMGGIIGELKSKNAMIADPTQIKAHGYVCDKNGNILNTRDFATIQSKKKERRPTKRAKMILCIGTSMNSGKSLVAAKCCHALASMGEKVRAAKITGTASQKDILLMEDSGAEKIADFTYLGYPSTYQLTETELLDIFTTIDLKYANNPQNYWLVEIADGILQRETALLLASDVVQQRIHRLILTARDTCGIAGGLALLNAQHGLTPHVVSGLCSSSPLSIGELEPITTIPIFNSLTGHFSELYELIK